MIRFRVVKGSHVLLALSILVLAVVVTLILLQGLPSPSRTAESTNTMTEARVLQTFASANYSEPGFRIEVAPDPSPSPAPAAGKRILIYHTHTHEAYAQAEDDPYIAVEAWRTEDVQHSVVRLGSALADELRAMGYEVIHDITDHEQQDISNSYVRSLKTLESYTEPFDLTIDLHRDAYVEGLSLDDGACAQLMLLVGRGDAYEGSEKPDYEGNLAFAQQLTYAMNQANPGICRNVTVKKGRYNQHIGNRAILAEVGHNLNTLEQALNSIPCLSRAIDKTLSEQL